MPKINRNWTRNELILAINLYLKLPFGRMHSRNPEVKHLAELINRTAGAVAYKLVNFASLDPSLRERGIKGAEHGSKLDKVIWDEFYNDWEELSFQSEKLLAEYENRSLDDKLDVTDAIPEGKVRESGSPVILGGEQDLATQRSETPCR